MAFIRIKRVYGGEYAYLVANSWTKTGPRQKVAKYLGKIIRPEKKENIEFGAFLGLKNESTQDWQAKKSFKEIAAILIEFELAKHNVPELQISTENSRFQDKRGKKVVLAINNGYLCEETVKRLLEYTANEDYSGYNLADALTAAGIAVEKNTFISLFGKAQSDAEKSPNEAFKDFYY